MNLPSFSFKSEPLWMMAPTILALLIILILQMFR